MTSLSRSAQFLAAGAGAVGRSYQSKGRDIVSRSDYATLAQMWAASTFGQKIDPTTGKVWFNTDPAALDYSTSRAGIANELIPGAVDQFNVSGNGVVNSGTELSQTIWQGRYLYMNKTGDGSAHSATIVGQLGAVGPGGYNELGGFQGQMTNLGSTLGTMSGVELLLSDSANAGTTSFNTKMQAIVGRIAKYNATARKSYHFYASSEGTLATDAVIGVNPAANNFFRAFDFSNANITSGQFGVVPNNTSLAWLDSTAAARTILGVDAGNNFYVQPASAAGSVSLRDFAGVSRLEVPGAGGLVSFQNASLSAAATAGVNGAPPAQVSGYLNVKINGTTLKLPYYNV
jgi:hypothetical protein